MQTTLTTVTEIPLSGPATTATTAPCTTPLVIFTAVEDAWADARDAMRWLAARDVPVVLVSRRPAEEVHAIQAACGLREPFVCGGGAALHIPLGYFPQLQRIGTRHDEWHVVEFRAPAATAHAVRLLASLYRLCNEQVTLVGLCDAWEDRVLLRELDVPVVVRHAARDQDALLQAFPDAYRTALPGARGWSEAVLGSMGG